MTTLSGINPNREIKLKSKGVKRFIPSFGTWLCIYAAALLLVFMTLLLGCAPLGPVSLPVAMGPMIATTTPTPTQALYLAPANATPTPTPFQPLSPTDVFIPTDTPQPTATPAFQPVDKPRKQGSSAKIDQPKNQVNILLLGSDQRPWDSIFRTDTIVLATLNTEKGTVNLTSFPRDLYVNIPGWGPGRINTAYQHGGFATLAATFEQNFGVRPDHYVLISFSSFKQIIDSLGGLDVDVEVALSDYRAGYYVTIPAGMVHMDADTVLWYVRSRKTSNDFARNRRQQEVIEAIVEKMLSLNAVKRIPEFYDIYKENVTTDLGLKDAIRFIPLAAKITDTSRINQYYIGQKHVYDWISPEGGMVLLPNQPEIMKVLRKALNSE